MPRLFVAVRIAPTPPLRKVLSSLADVRGVKAVAPENVHYTLRFLGDVEDGVAATLRDELLPTADLGVASFALQMRGVGTFPGPKRPRVVWVGCDADAGRHLSALAERIDGVAMAAGLGGRDKPFAPHLTIARVKHLEGRGKRVIQDLLHEHQETTFGTCTIDHVALVESKLTPSGPIYTDIATAQLRAEAEDTS